MVPERGTELNVTFRAGDPAQFRQLGGGRGDLVEACLELALINHNDFGMTDGVGAFDAQGRLDDNGVEATETYVRLPRGV
jgi:hypothetical protein